MTLTTAIRGVQIEDVSISGAHLVATNSPTDGQVLTWNTTQSKFEWDDLGSMIAGETPIGDINGTNKLYTLDNEPETDTEMIHLNGLLQERGAVNDYTTSGTTITFVVAPETNDIILASYLVSQGLGGGGADHGGLSGLSDDDHTHYSLINGARAFTSTVAGITPVAGADLTTKTYVDGKITTHEGLADPHTGYILADGTRAFTGNIQANASGTLDIGSDAVPFKDLYLTGASLYINGDKAVGYTGGSVTFYGDGSNLTGISGVTDHGALTGKDDDDHTQYLLIDGSRSMTGSLDLDTIGTDEFTIGSSRAIAMPVNNTNVAIGHGAGNGLTTGVGNTAVGNSTLSKNQTGDNNVAIGYCAYLGGAANSSSSRTVTIGAFTAQLSRSGYDDNVAIGYSANYTGRACDRSVYVGSEAGRGTVSAGPDDAVILGYRAGYVVEESDFSVFIGSESGYTATDAANSVFMGRQSGYSMVDGTGNVFIGYQAAYNETGSNKLYIENSNSSTPLIYGEFDNDLLEVNGNLTSNGVILTASGTHDGTVITATVDDASALFGNALYCAADFHYERCDANAAATMPCCALALESGAGSKKILLIGQISNSSWDWSTGNIYVSATTGELTQTAPSSSGDQVQIVGFALSADTIFFNPNLTLVEVA